jgi:DNA-binding MarR family transcriptional regulator
MDIEQIHTVIERLSNLLRNEVRRAGGEAGLQPVQIEALHYLAICNRYSDTPMGVTEYLGQTKGTVSQTLKVLERKGYLNKLADREDKRVSHLKVSAAGRRLLNKVIPTSNFSDAIQSLDKMTQKQTGEMLQTLLRGIQQANGSKTFGVCKTCRYNEIGGKGNYYCGLVKAPLSSSDITLICREHEDAA